MGIKTFEEIESLFRSRGVTQLYVKHLAKKQDNERNQIYLGYAGSTNILSMFPAKLDYRAPSTSTEKAHSDAGTPIVQMLLNFFWIYDDDSEWVAPNAKIINYFQYPEARFSGFFQSCKRKPDCLRRDDLDEFGKRILVLGANKATGKTYGLAISEREDPIVGVFPELPSFDIVPILQTHIIGRQVGASPKALLLNDLIGICGRWHPSSILKDIATGPTPFKGNQGAGYTLEALLGVSANADKKPDKHGFEIKSFMSGGKISLMTPTADMGEEARLTFREFMNLFGWPPVKDERLSRVFNGTFRYRKPKYCKYIDKTIELDVGGYDLETNKFSEREGQVFISMEDRVGGVLIAGWSLNKLLNSWNDKHSQACYVEYEKRRYTGTGTAHDWEYRYTGRVLICESTDIWKYIQGIAARIIYYDPGHDLTNSGKANQRPQWRITANKKITDSLQALYEKVNEEFLF